MFRKPSKEDLKDFKFDKDEKCFFCDTVGAYRTTECYLCEAHFLEMITLEEEDGTNIRS